MLELINNVSDRLLLERQVENFDRHQFTIEKILIGNKIPRAAFNRSRSSSVVESLPSIREAWVQISATPTKALEQGLNLYLLLGPYLDGAPAC